MNAQEAYDVLLHAKIFQDSHVGPAARIPETVRALLSLLSTPHASEAFNRLLAEATLAGQLYALCGLYYADHEAFKEAVKRYRYWDDLIMTQHGCLVEEERVSDLIEYIIGGRYPSMFRSVAKYVAE